MIRAFGAVAALLGLVVVRSSRRGEGLGSAFMFVLGIALCVLGVYCVFFEDGRGAARWLPFLVD